MRVDAYPLHVGAAPATLVIIDPDVSTSSMKYGFDDFGHCAGSGLKHAAGSCAAAEFVHDSPPSAVAANKPNPRNRLLRMLIMALLPDPIALERPRAHNKK